MHDASLLRVRWLGRVAYREALAVQQALFDHGREQHLLLLEHDHVFTYGPHADLERNLRCDPAEVGPDFVAVVGTANEVSALPPGLLQIELNESMAADKRVRLAAPVEQAAANCLRKSSASSKSKFASKACS